MTVTPHETATRTPVTPRCSACGSPSREYTSGCSTCTDRRRQHRRRDKLRAEREANEPGRLLIVSSGGGVGRIVWRPEAKCGASCLSRMVEGMRRRKGDSDLELLRKIVCGKTDGQRVLDAVQTTQDDDGAWDDLESVRELVDALEPEPERVVFVDDGERLTCTWGGRGFVLELRPGGRWRLSEVSSGRFARSTPGLVRTVNQARAWARVTVGRGWPK